LFFVGAQILPDQQCLERQKARLRVIVKAVLIKHVDSFRQIPVPEFSSPAHRTELRMGQLLAEDETSLAGTTTILRKIGEELELKDELILTHGDQLTVNRIVGAQETLANEDTRADRLENFVPVPGGFHFRWKLLRLISENWWGHAHYPGSVGHAKEYLGRNAVDRPATKFAHCHEKENYVIGKTNRKTRNPSLFNISSILLVFFNITT